MKKNLEYNKAVKEIKDAILISQYESIKSINEKQILLYASIGRYVSENTRNGAWGKGAISVISKELNKQIPGLRGFSEKNIKNMRSFYEEWSNILSCNNDGYSKSVDASTEITTLSCNFKNNEEFVSYFLENSFSNHCLILRMAKSVDERIYYIKRSAEEHLSYRQLQEIIEANEFHHKGKITNNFKLTIKDGKSASKALRAFSDQILLPAVIVEELNARDISDVDEKELENLIVHHIKNFILTMGKGFAFIQNQFRIKAFNEEEFVDLLFFNRDLNCLVAVELKTGKFKPAYLGQLSSYLTLINKYEKRSHENPPIGIILCKEFNKAKVDFLIQDFKNPLGVSTYKITNKLPEKYKKILPNINDLKKYLESEDIKKE